MSEANKKLVRDFFKAILEGDPAILDQFVSEDQGLAAEPTEAAAAVPG